MHLELVTWHRYLYSLHLWKLLLFHVWLSARHYLILCSPSLLKTTWQFSLSHVLVQPLTFRHILFQTSSLKWEPAKIHSLPQWNWYICHSTIFYTLHGSQNHLTIQIPEFSSWADKFFSVLYFLVFSTHTHNHVGTKTHNICISQTHMYINI